MNANCEQTKLKFVDLFAGLGGFHQALEHLGCECVFASELKEDLRDLYNINFPGTPIRGDITQISPREIPKHDILCAGFPCQPFSQAGKRQGFHDEKDRGNLFYYIWDILKEHRPRYVILENVSNLKGHDNGNTWNVILSKLQDLNYSVKEEIISPHQFGIPQHRKRIYIVCQQEKYGTLDNFQFPKGSLTPCAIQSVIDENDTNITPLKQETINQLQVWQEFIDETIKHGESIPTFPIWSMEFGATYEFEKIAPAFQSFKDLKGKRGKFGKPLQGRTKGTCLLELPIYAQSKTSKIFPHWKIRYIQQNREFYIRNKVWLDNWLKKVQNFDNSHLKFEWNCGKGASPIIEDKIVQFRASGIRVKLPTFSPALNLVGTQIPIFPWIKLPQKFQNINNTAKGRYMTLKEAAAVQRMQGIKFGDETFTLSINRCYEALGNAVNVEIVELIAKELMDYGTKCINSNKASCL